MKDSCEVLDNKPQAFFLIFDEIMQFILMKMRRLTPTPTVVQREEMENEHHPEKQTIYHRQDMFKSLNGC